MPQVNLGALHGRTRSVAIARNRWGAGTVGTFFRKARVRTAPGLAGPSRKSQRIPFTGGAKPSIQANQNGLSRRNFLRSGGKVSHKPDARSKLRASRASEPRERSAPAKRRARARVGESEGRSPSDKTRTARSSHPVPAVRRCSRTAYWPDPRSSRGRNT